jgi:hypothetical protein
MSPLAWNDAADQPGPEITSPFREGNHKRDPSGVGPGEQFEIQYNVSAHELARAEYYIMRDYLSFMSYKLFTS